MTNLAATSPSFAVVYSRALAQYVVERGEMRVVPTRGSLDTVDPECAERAAAMCVALNRVYAVTERA